MFHSAQPEIEEWSSWDEDAPTSIKIEGGNGSVSPQLDADEEPDFFKDMAPTIRKTQKVRLQTVRCAAHRIDHCQPNKRWVMIYLPECTGLHTRVNEYTQPCQDFPHFRKVSIIMWWSLLIMWWWLQTNQCLNYSVSETSSESECVWDVIWVCLRISAKEREKWASGVWMNWINEWIHMI